MCLHILEGWSNLVLEALVVVWGGLVVVWRRFGVVWWRFGVVWGVSMDRFRHIHAILFSHFVFCRAIF